MNIKSLGLVIALFLLGFQAQIMAQTFTGAGNPQAIPTVGTGGFPCTGGPTESVAAVTLAGNVGTDFLIDNVTINLTHTWDSDIEADLVSPGGTVWDLTSDNGGAGDNFTNTVFQDGAPSITTGAAPFTGTFQAEQGPFAVGFAGEAINGNWTLSICDDAGGDVGELLSFEITFVEPCILTPPADANVNTDPGVCEANVTGLIATGNASCVDPIVNDFNGGGADASGVYPLGITTVTWTSGISPAVTATVTVSDNEAPVFANCPGDMTFTLDPGDCEYIYNYDLGASDNCPVFGPATLVTQNNSFDVASISNSVACPGGGYETYQAYNLAALGFTGNVQITEVTFGVFATTGAPTVTANIYSINAIPALPGALNFANMTLLGSGSVVLPAGGASIQSIPLAAPVLASGNIVISLETPGSIANGFIPGYNTAGLTAGTTYLSSGFCNVAQPTPISSIIGGFTDQWMVGIQAAAEVDLPVVQLSGDPSGTPLAHGNTYSYSFIATDAAGNTATCEFDVTVEEFPTPTASLNCNLNGIQVSLDPDCEATVGADDILEGGPYNCYDNYTVELFFDANLTQRVPTSPDVTSANIGQTLWAMVSDGNNNSCWGTIYVEDKHIPELECTNIELGCDNDTAPGNDFGGTLSSSNDVNLGTQDNGTVMSTFVVSGANSNPTDVNVTLDVTHTWVGDLVITLTSPAGTSVELLNNIGGPGFGCAGNDLAITLDDEAAATYDDLDGTCDNLPAAAGDFQPLNPLSAFDGENVNGTWTVSVQDLALGDAGRLNNITLDFALPVLGTIPFPVPATTTVFQTNAQRGTQEYTVRNFDGCSDVILAYSDWIDDIDCLLDPTNPYTKVIFRTWTATDASGNTTQCQDTLGLLRATMADLIAPPNFDNLDEPALQCDEKETAPANNFCGTVVGWNAIDSGPYAGHPSPYDELYPCGNVKWFGTGVPGGIDCGNINYTFEDIRINVCQDGSSEGCYKVVRNWSILDWCNGDFLTYTQFLKVEDNEGPTITDIEDITISVAAWECEAAWYVTEPWIMDNCSDIDGLYTVTSTAGTVTYVPSVGRYSITGLPLGVHQVKVRALDCCGNATEVEIDLTVEDLVPPYVTCEVFRTTSLTISGESKIWAESFDDGSYDACGPVYFKVIRMEDLLGTDDGSNSNQSSTDCDLINGDDNPTRFGNQIYFDDYLKYCCEDIGVAGLQAKLRVFDRDPGAGPINPNRMRPGGDLYGHYNDCWSNVTVEDKLAPFISCPDDITVDCDFWFDMNDLNTTFGTVRDDINDVEYITINGVNVGQDGVAGDNCSVTISENVVDNLTCGQGTITRIFTATDPDGRTASCVQRITIIDNDPYFINDTNCFNFDPFDGVRWPCNYNASSCGAATDPSVAGEPQIFNDDNCALISVTYDDEDFPIVPDACFKIKRIWTITDWCQYDEFDSDGNDVYDPTDDGVIPGQWEYVQYIKVLNSTVPEFGSCDDIEICGYNTDCTAAAALTNTVSDDCTPGDLLVVDFKIDANNDGTYDFIGSNVTPYPYPNPMGLPILSVSYSDADGDGTYDVTIQNVDYPVGTHRILWSAEDVCSNVGTCEYLFEAQDCAKPTPKAFHGLAVDIQPVTNLVCVTAMMLDAGSFDNCGVQQLRIGPAGGPGQTVPPSSDEICFDCNDLGTNNVDLWVQDVNGNWDYVASYIQVQNNMGACIGPVANIEGGIDNELGAPVAGVNVTLNGNAPTMPDVYVTATNGTYEFANMSRTHNYEVEPAKNDDYDNGVSTLDIVLLSRHLIGLETLNSPYKLIAADVDRSNSVNTFDIVAIQQMLLYITTEFANNTSWRFVDGAHTFDNPQNPWSSTFPEVCAFNGLDNQNVADFVAVKIGDLNGNAATSAASQGGDRSFHGDVNFQIDNATMVAGEEYTVDFKASDFTKLAGYQFTLNLDQQAVDFVDVKAGDLAGLSSANFGLALIDEGVITTSWANSDLVSMDDDAVVFSVTVKAKAAAQLSNVLSLNSRYTVAEAYNENLDLLNIGLTFNNDEVVSNEFALYQNQPNPFKEETVIGFNLPADGEVTVSIYDVSGKVLKVINGDFAKGYNQVSVTRNELAASGVLYYQVDTANDSATMKMIIVE